MIAGEIGGCRERHVLAHPEVTEMSELGHGEQRFRAGRLDLVQFPAEVLDECLL